MTNARITVDRKVEFDGNVDEWDRKPPSMFADAIKPGSRPQPWLRSAAVALADAVTAGRSVKLNITTTGAGWSMKVEYK